mmetsp:Transcript_13820/g.17034  ORF Transcript_13820/g.17034 Transcript_13820/m.17034 type:complete len:121 (-) Transcript_13820:56-418(-)
MATFNVKMCFLVVLLTYVYTGHSQNYSYLCSDTSCIQYQCCLGNLSNGNTYTFYAGYQNNCTELGGWKRTPCLGSSSVYGFFMILLLLLPFLLLGCCMLDSIATPLRTPDKEFLTGKDTY